jgi:hypothetical protein
VSRARDGARAATTLLEGRIPPGADIAKLPAEVEALCPDVVSQGTGTVDALAHEVRSSGTLYCWWD